LRQAARDRLVKSTVRFDVFGSGTVLSPDFLLPIQQLFFRQHAAVTSTAVLNDTLLARFDPQDSIDRRQVSCRASNRCAPRKISTGWPNEEAIGSPLVLSRNCTRPMPPVRLTVS
jgi:hypothetical protein